MATSLQTTITVLGGNKVVEAHVISPADIPLDVFIYENTGTTELGEYIGVVNFQDYARIQPWTGAALPIFGNKFVKHSQATFTRPLTISSQSILDKLDKDLTQFKLEYLNQGSVTTVLPI